MEAKTEQKKPKTQKQRQRRPANLPARFAFRHQIKSNSKATQNGARSHQKYPNKSMGWPPDSGLAPQCLKYAQTNSLVAKTMQMVKN